MVSRCAKCGAAGVRLTPVEGRWMCVRCRPPVTAERRTPSWQGRHRCPLSGLSVSRRGACDECPWGRDGGCDYTGEELRP